MLNLMRKNAGSWIIKVVFCIIVLVFVFWGVGSFREDRAKRVALVNDEAVSLASYQAAYDHALQMLQKQYGSDLNQDMIKMFQVPQRIIENLITKTLVLQEAEKLGIRVSDKEVALAIQGIPAFQEAGIFSAARYRSLLSQNRFTPEQFEDDQRHALTIEKLQKVINSGIKVADSELLDWYNWKNTSVDIDYLAVDAAAMIGIVPTDQDLQAYYDKYKERYKTEEKVKVRYLAFGPDQFRREISIADDTVKEYYDAHPSEFAREKTVTARHILFRVEEAADDAAVEKIKEKAEDVAKMAKGGKIFADLAKQYSEDPGSKEDGGYLDAFTKEAMVAPFAETAFSMKVGEISDPVRTQFGWHIIKVEKVTEASVTSLKDAASGIREKLTTEAAKGLAYDKAEAVFDAMMKEDDVEKTAATLNMTFHATDYFSSQGPDRGVANPEQFAKAAFALKDSEISNVLEIGDSYYILQKSDVLPAKIPELSEVAGKVKTDVTAALQDEAAAKKADELVKALQGGGDMEKLAKASGLKFGTTGFFKRYGEIPGIGPVAGISQASFSLTETQQIADKAIKGAKGYYAIRLKARKGPDPAGFEAEKETLRAQLLSRKQESLYGSWLEKVRAGSKISIEEGYLK